MRTSCSVHPLTLPKCASGKTNSENPHFAQTISLGKTKNGSLFKPSNTGMCTHISDLSSLKLLDAQDLQIVVFIGIGPSSLKARPISLRDITPERIYAMLL